MFEIIAILLTFGQVGEMARRRGRSAILFELMFLVCWFCGEIAGGIFGFLVNGILGLVQPNLLLIYGFAFAGALFGAGFAFLLAKCIGPVDGIWRDPSQTPIQNSRLLGAVIGGIGGGTIGAIAMVWLYRREQLAGNWSIVLQGFLVVGFVGALLGLVSGVRKN